MMGACMIRKGVGVSVGMSALVVAIIPACLVLAWVAMGCMWVLGLLSVVKVMLRLMWSPRMDARKRQEKEKEKRRRREAAEAEAEAEQISAEMRLSLFQQYLDDQLHTLTHHLRHVCHSDSLPSHVDLPLHVEICDWAAVDDPDCPQAQHM